MSTRRKFLQSLSAIVVLSMILSAFSVPAASAQQEGSEDIERQVNAQTGKVSFIGPESGWVLPASEALGTSRSARPDDPGMALAERFGPEFGLKNPASELTRLKTNHSENGQLSFHYQQDYQGIPVMGGELIVNTNEAGDLYSMNGEVSPDLSLSTQPTIDPEQAQQAALQGAAEWYQKTLDDFLVSAPELWIYDESLLQPSTRPAELVWRMEVTPKDPGMPVRELVLVNAENGIISLHFNQVDTAWGRMLENSSAPSPSTNPKTDISSSVESQIAIGIETYTANNTSDLRDEFVCNQTDPTCAAGNANAKSAHKYAIGTYQFYLTNHNRNSIDNSGMTIISTVDYCKPESCPAAYDNAYWSGAQMVYGNAHGYAMADDIVAHELTHGVTQYESTLFYYYQSGAIDESFADLWGEYYDQTNGDGTDTDGVKWLIGEDVTGLGAFRSMSNPPSFGSPADPDKLTSATYRLGAGDNGGVHHNSGVNNKAVYLMVQGGTFNTQTVTALGWQKTTAIYYKANTDLLTSAADYSDLYYALQQACSSLIGQKGISAADCVEVKDALDAVEMNSQPLYDSNFNTDAPECDTGNPPIATIFSDDLESGTGSWIFTNGTYTRWQLDSDYYGPYAHSGSHSLYADDAPAKITDATARLSSFTIPFGAYLRFAHAYEFHGDSSNYDDGGVLE